MREGSDRRGQGRIALARVVLRVVGALALLKIGVGTFYGADAAAWVHSGQIAFSLSCGLASLALWRRDLPWAALLALLGSAYTLGTGTTFPVEAFLPAALVVILLDQPVRMQAGRHNAAALLVFCVALATVNVAGFGNPWPEVFSRRWLEWGAPTVLVVSAWLVARHWQHGIWIGERGWIVAAGVLPSAAYLTGWCVVESLRVCCDLVLYYPTGAGTANTLNALACVVPIGLALHHQIGDRPHAHRDAR